ncbi:MAG: hypothetical protein ACTHYJ_10225 [Brevibacterium yomogidense]
MSRASERDSVPAAEEQGEYLFVWGDTVRGRRLLVGVIVGVACGLIGLYGGGWLVDVIGVADHLVDVWALITGILGCLAAGVITARLFSPARVISDDAHESGSIAAAIEELSEGRRGLGTLEDASALSRSELEAAGLTDEFRNAEDAAAQRGRTGGDR